MTSDCNSPLVAPFDYQDPFFVFKAVEKLFPDHILWLDSNGFKRALFPTGRYSYIAFDPDPTSVIMANDTGTFVGGQHTKDLPFDAVQNFLKALPKMDTHPDVPPFQGGIAGFFGYELLHTLEKVPLCHESHPEKKFIDHLMVAFYDRILAFDHHKEKAWIISAHPDDQKRQERLIHTQKIINQVPTNQEKDVHIDPPLQKLDVDLSESAYHECIQKTLDYIVAGDIFQANFTRRLFGKISPDVDLIPLYHRLRSYNPAPFAGFLKWHSPAKDPATKAHTFAILSSSPERFIQMNANGQMETRPIKGTRRKHLDPKEDAIIQESLLNNEKDRAENLMIVDLMRNDLSRVCKPFTVKTPVICGLESYQTVHHLVSVVEGHLKEGLDAIDVLKATFPGGSITGAPKIRAMEIISELEPVRRGPYCGSMGYIGLDGSMDTSIMIRTLVVQDDQISFHVGGGIVIDSTPEDEYHETCTKAAALAMTLTGKTIEE